MVAKLIQCPTIDDPRCIFYAFNGFQNTSNKYGSVTIFDWDCCLYSAGISGDSAEIPGYGTLYQPTTATINCNTGLNLQCAGVNPGGCYYDPPNPGSWNGLVDGHITYTALSECYAQVTEGAGAPIVTYPLGTIIPFNNDNILAILGAVQNDQYAYSNIINSVCNNSDGKNIFLVLSNPSPDNE